MGTKQIRYIVAIVHEQAYSEAVLSACAQGTTIRCTHVCPTLLYMQYTDIVYAESAVILIFFPLPPRDLILLLYNKLLNFSGNFGNLTFNQLPSSEATIGNILPTPIKIPTHTHTLSRCKQMSVLSHGS